MLGDYSRRPEDEGPQVPPEHENTRKKRQSVRTLGKLANRPTPVRMNLLMPDINRLLESDKRESFSQASNSEYNMFGELEVQETYNTVPETICGVRPIANNHNSAGLLSSRNNHWKVPTVTGETVKFQNKEPALTVTKQPFQQPHATPIKCSSLHQDTSSETTDVALMKEVPQHPSATPIKDPPPNQESETLVPDAEKENFTPMKVQKGTISSTPATNRGPLSLLYSDRSERKAKSSEDDVGVRTAVNPLAPQSIENISTSTPLGFTRSRLYGTSSSRGYLCSLSSDVPLHPKVAAVVQQSSKQSGNLQNLSQPPMTPQSISLGNSIKAPLIPSAESAEQDFRKLLCGPLVEPNKFQRLNVEVSPASVQEASNFHLTVDDASVMKESKSVVSVDQKCAETKVTAFCQVPPATVHSERRSPTSVNLNVEVARASLQDASNGHKTMDGVPVMKESKSVISASPKCADARIAAHCQMGPTTVRSERRSPVSVENVAGRLSDSDQPSKIPTTPRSLAPQEPRNLPCLPENSQIKVADRPNSTHQNNIKVMPVTGSKDENVFQVPKPISNTNRCLKGMNQIIVNSKSYSILSLLGRGGSSVVYQVLDTTSKLLAIKCVNLSDTDESICIGYLNEIKLLAKLQDGDCVIRMFDYEHRKENNLLYVVMEKGDTDLSKLIKEMCRSKKISVSMILYYWIEMLRAVSFIHRHGTIHSDLKPANFLLVSGRLKLIDFGIASSVQGDMTSVLKDNMTGSYNYISPEALCGVGSAEGQRYKITYKSDVWSLGCILYNLIYGHTPFQSIQGQFQKLNAIVNTSYKIPFPTPPIDGCPFILLKALQACLVRNPKDRPSVDELLLLPYIGHEGPEKAMLMDISMLVASVELETETDGKINSPSAILKAIQKIFQENETRLPFLRLKK